MGKGYWRTRFARGCLADADFILVAHEKLEVIVEGPALGGGGGDRRDGAVLARAPLRGLRLPKSSEEHVARLAAVPFEALVEGVAKLAPAVPVIALKPPYTSYPGDRLVELVATEGRYVRR